ncbi:hypothetical protein [Synoicihabitans lomoniglobus]|uniref:Uncharacterized protein n=1 Tax=Synoicihabitans lomoniglobus TaxID=2909285 RepID=A0AAF0A1G0_9BACT|nr:hypothetical protein [Opitutaceae bacterium LMO-M01]WED64987.1 hypothetical protein PXH66_21780 [Opitutaceae bacterium LMO-M01]
MALASRSLLEFEIRTPHAHVTLKVPAQGVSARFEPELSPYKSKLSPPKGIVRTIVATGQEEFRATQLRPTPPAKTVCATAAVAQKKAWFTVATAPKTIASLQTTPDKVDSLWLVAVLSFRHLAMSRSKPFLVWLIGKTSSFVVSIDEHGAFATSRRESGSSDLIDAVKKGLGLHFRSSAEKILFREDFDWGDDADEIAHHYTAGLCRDFRTVPPETTLAVIGIGQRARGLERAFAAAIGVEPWSGPTESEMSQLGWEPLPHGAEPASAEYWALACLAGPRSTLFTHRLRYGGAPFAMTHEPATAGGLVTIAREPGLPAPATATQRGTTEPTRPRRRRSRYRPPRRNVFEWTKGGVLKWIAILIYIALVGFGGHYYMTRDSAPTQQR